MSAAWWVVCATPFIPAALRRMFTLAVTSIPMLLLAAWLAAWIRAPESPTATRAGASFRKENNAGGLVGLMETDTRIDRSWAAGAVSSSGDYTGGLVGSGRRAGRRCPKVGLRARCIPPVRKSADLSAAFPPPNALFDNNWSLTRIIEGVRSAVL